MLSDCRAAIDLAVKYSRVTEHNMAIGRLKRGVLAAKSLEKRVMVAWVPGHAGVDQNEVADEQAKAVLKSPFQAPKSELSLRTCGKGCREMGKRTWQRRWDRGTTGRYTHNLMPQVGKKKMMPALRGEGVAYCRLLLNSTLLLEHQKMKKIEATTTCDYNTAIEGVSHFLIEWPLTLISYERSLRYLNIYRQKGSDPDKRDRTRNTEI